MTWSPKMVDLTRPMTQETIIERAGKMVEGDSPYKRLKLECRRLRLSALPLPVPGSSGSLVRAVVWEE